MKEKLIQTLYKCWACTDDDLNDGLWENLTNLITNEGINGAEELLDICRCEYDAIKEKYQNRHNLNDDEMEKIMDEHCGNYEFMYGDIPYVETLDKAWDLCNYYLDYCNDNSERNLNVLLSCLEDMNNENI